MCSNRERHRTILGDRSYTLIETIVYVRYAISILNEYVENIERVISTRQCAYRHFRFKHIHYSLFYTLDTIRVRLKLHVCRLLLALNWTVQKYCTTCVTVGITCSPWRYVQIGLQTWTRRHVLPRRKMPLKKEIIIYTYIYIVILPRYITYICTLIICRYLPRYSRNNAIYILSLIYIRGTWG